MKYYIARNTGAKEWPESIRVMVDGKHLEPEVLATITKEREDWVLEVDDKIANGLESHTPQLHEYPVGALNLNFVSPAASLLNTILIRRKP